MFVSFPVTGDDGYDILFLKWKQVVITRIGCVYDITIKTVLFLFIVIMLIILSTFLFHILYVTVLSYLFSSIGSLTFLLKRSLSCIYLYRWWQLELELYTKQTKEILSVTLRFQTLQLKPPLVYNILVKID